MIQRQRRSPGSARKRDRRIKRCFGDADLCIGPRHQPLAGGAGAHSRALGRWPALACAFATSPSTVRRILPQRSGTQLADTEVLKELLVNPDRPAPVLLLEPPPVRERCALAFRSTVGKKVARAWATIHSAC